MVEQMGCSRRQNQVGRNVRGRVAPGNHGRNRPENHRHRIYPRAGLHPLEGVLQGRAFRPAELHLLLRRQKARREAERGRSGIPLAQTGRGETIEAEQADEGFVGSGHEASKSETQKSAWLKSPSLTLKSFTALAGRTRNARSHSDCCSRWSWKRIFPPLPKAIRLRIRLIISLSRNG